MGDPSTSSASRKPHSVFSELVQKLVHKLRNTPQPQCVQGRSTSTSTDAEVIARCFHCDECKYVDKLNTMREQAEYIVSTFDKMSYFEDDLEKHVNILDQGGTNLANEWSFKELVCAVEHFRFQMPYTSLYEFRINDHPTRDEDTSLKQYDDLTPLQQKCLYYCSVFNGDFKKRVLVNWWIGEGLLEGDLASLEREAEMILKVLGDHKFIVPLLRKRLPPNTWRMEPSVRQFVRSKWCDQLPELVLLKSDAQIDIVDTSQVKTVLNVNKSTVGSHESKMLAYMGSLQVLNLGRSHSDQHVQVKALKLILEGLRKMKQLRLLSLEGISSITKLPVSSSLRETLLMPTSLMVLVLRGCQSLELLPSSIGSLINLIHLDLSDCYILRKMPREIRFLSKLEVLKGFVINNKGSSSLEDLGLLKKLQKLSICVSKPDFPEHLDLVNLANIEGLVKLKILWRLIASRQKQGSTESLQNGQIEQIVEIAAEQSQGDADSAQNEQTEQATEIESQQNQGNVNSPKNEQMESASEIASERNPSDVDSPQNGKTEQATEIAPQQNQWKVYSLQNEQAIELTSLPNQGHVNSLQSEQATEIAPQHNQEDVDFVQNEQIELATEIASQQKQGNVDSAQNKRMEQDAEMASQQSQGNVDSRQLEQATDIASHQNQDNVDFLQNEKSQETSPQQNQGDVDSVQNEKIEQATDIASQSSFDPLEIHQIEQTTEIASQQSEQTIEIAEGPQIEGVVNNANSVEQEQDNTVLNNPVKPAVARRLLNCFFGNQMASSENADVFKKLEKLDVWCAPTCAGEVLLDPHRFPSLKHLYIRGAAFHRLPTTNPYLKLEKLRLLFLTNFHMEWVDRSSIFPVLSYLEVQSSRNLDEFSQHCNEEGVWPMTQ